MKRKPTQSNWPELIKYFHDDAAWSLKTALDDDFEIIMKMPKSKRAAILNKYISVHDRALKTHILNTRHHLLDRLREYKTPLAKERLEKGLTYITGEIKRAGGMISFLKSIRDEIPRPVTSDPEIEFILRLIDNVDRIFAADIENAFSSEVLGYLKRLCDKKAITKKDGIPNFRTLQQAFAFFDLAHKKCDITDYESKPNIVIENNILVNGNKLKNQSIRDARTDFNKNPQKHYDEILKTLPELQ